MIWIIWRCEGLWPCSQLVVKWKCLYSSGALVWWPAQAVPHTNSLHVCLSGFTIILSLVGPRACQFLQDLLVVKQCLYGWEATVPCLMSCWSGRSTSVSLWWAYSASMWTCRHPSSLGKDFRRNFHIWTVQKSACHSSEPAVRRGWGWVGRETDKEWDQSYPLAAGCPVLVNMLQRGLPRMETGGIVCSHLLPAGLWMSNLCQRRRGWSLAQDLCWGLAKAHSHADVDNPAGLSQIMHFELPLAFHRQIIGM